MDEPQLALVAAEVREHEHEPASGTIYTSSGLPVQGKLTQFDSYPIEAVCLICGEPIRRGQFFAVGPEGEWQLKYPDGQR